MQTLDLQRFIFKPAMKWRVQPGTFDFLDQVRVTDDDTWDLTRHLMSTTGSCRLNDEREQDIDTRQVAFRRAAGPAVLPPPQPPALNVFDDLE